MRTDDRGIAALPITREAQIQRQKSRRVYDGSAKPGPHNLPNSIRCITLQIPVLRVSWGGYSSRGSGSDDQNLIESHPPCLGMEKWKSGTRPTIFGASMLYVTTLVSGAKILVSALSPNAALRKVEERLDTRVDRVDLLEYVFHHELDGLAYVIPMPSSIT